MPRIWQPCLEVCTLPGWWPTCESQTFEFFTFELEVHASWHLLAGLRAAKNVDRERLEGLDYFLKRAALGVTSSTGLGHSQWPLDTGHVFGQPLIIWLMHRWNAEMEGEGKWERLSHVMLSMHFRTSAVVNLTILILVHVSFTVLRICTDDTDVSVYVWVIGCIP